MSEDVTDRFGAHMSISGGHDRAADAAGAAGCGTLQVFTKSSNQWRAVPLTDAHLAAFRAAVKKHRLNEAIGHTSYLINLGTVDPDLRNKSIDALTVELERAEALGLSVLVHHPGAHVGAGEDVGLAQVAKGLDEVHRRCRGFACRIALETTAGQGSCLGHRAEHLGRIVGLVAEPERVAVCCDTCHLFAAGYALGSEEEYNATIAELDAAFGVERIRAWHLNDSVKPRGSRVDRHAGIGLGAIGREPFGRLVNDPRFARVPMILETPKGTDENGEDLDRVNLRVLRGLVRAEPEARADVRSPGS